MLMPSQQEKTMRTQAEKAVAFRELHERPGTFIIPNPWDPGTARLLASLGFEALATTSLGLANIWGRGTVSADEIIDNARMIAAATDLPTNGDLENCGADEPEEAAQMIRRASEAGLAGGSIEDFTGDRTNPIYGFNLAVERVHAAVEMARKLPIPFVLTARAEQLIHGSTDIDATIRRLQAFEQAGADVLYAPGLKDLETIGTVVASVSKPVNVVMTHADPSITAADLAAAGVKRISIGGSGSRFALNAFMAAAREMAERGTFTFVAENPPWKDLLDAFAKGKG
jgi:2-methylisocitrate lyase-like PEP mutase family enzyme